MKKKTIIKAMAGILAFASSAVYSQSNVAINSTAALGNTSAVLDLSTGNPGTQGFLAPTVTLTNVTTLAPITGSGPNGLLVYTTASPTGGNGPGFYYWNGTKWLYVMNSNTGVGNGTANYLARWLTATTLGIGLVQDNATDVGINNAPVAGTMLTVTGGATNSGINATTTYTLTGSYAVHGNDTTGIDGYLGYTGPTVAAAGYKVTKAGGYFTGTSGTCAPLVATTTGTNQLAAIQGLSNNWHGGFFVTSLGSAVGLVGYNDSVENTARKSTGDGLAGFTSQSAGFGVFGENLYGHTNIGVGIMGIGSGGKGSYFGDGEGVMGDGGAYGIEGYADTTVASVTAAGGYFADGNGSYVYVGSTNTSLNYKVNGNGSVATIVKDQNNKNINLFCPEAPEVLFEDFGQGNLVSGKTHITLDPNYSKNVEVNQNHPLRIIITMNDACPNTIYVTNRTATGFDVVENNNGNSNASFTYEVIANRANEINPDGSVAKYAEARFPEGPGPRPYKKTANQKSILNNVNTAQSNTQSK